MFPSPQGGSETCKGNSEKVLFHVSIPSRRVGDQKLKGVGQNFTVVSIPSRRVGDLPSKHIRVWHCKVSIPSRRVGDQTKEVPFELDEDVSIPSRRVGDFFLRLLFSHSFSVSIPSRRVGDLTGSERQGGIPICFHPLKAGRRLNSFFPVVPVCFRFHPLKAGRRQTGIIFAKGIKSLFPSPQGGSETELPPKPRLKVRKVSIPSRRVGDEKKRLRMPKKF